MLLSFPEKVRLFKVIRDLKVPFSVPNDSYSSCVELLNVKVERRKAGGLERSRLWKRGRFDKLVLQHALEREDTWKNWNLTWMDDTLWDWVICEQFLPLETNESTNYLIMISVRDQSNIICYQWSWLGCSAVLYFPGKIWRLNISDAC